MNFLKIITSDEQVYCINPDQVTVIYENPGTKSGRIGSISGENIELPLDLIKEFKGLIGIRSE